MSTFLADNNKLGKDEVVRIAADCLRQKVQAVSQIGSGRNSRVFHVTCPSAQYALKFYFQHPSDSRNRLAGEFDSFSFLWDKGVRAVPQPLAKSLEYHCAAYDFIEGAEITQITRQDVDEAADFLSLLKDLSQKPGVPDFLPASEACFSGQEIINMLRARLKRLDLKEAGAEYRALQEYLKGEFVPLLEGVERWSMDYLAGQGLSWEEKLAQECRTLSPSDFGFHNALRVAERIVFLDFEYFGWDDPAKMVSDFLWHPAMTLTEDLKTYFVQRMSEVFKNDAHFQARLKGFFPLFGLKWCMIFLNEFSPADARRRDFAGQPAPAGQPALAGQPADKTAVRLEQLAKARRLLQTISHVYKEFPYGCKV